MTLMKLLATGALAIATTASVASAQQLQLPPGRLYAFHSSATASCPALDWHLVVGAGGALAGMISWNNMESLAQAVGNIDIASGAFKMTAKELGGQGRTATIDGTVSPSNGSLTANIHGENVNCQHVQVPWVSPPQGGSG
jgi:hypothetical protein